MCVWGGGRRKDAKREMKRERERERESERERWWNKKQRGVC